MKLSHKLGLGIVLLAAAAGAAYKFYPRQDVNQPLAFVPADTPYVFANIDVLDDATYQALLARANKELPASLAAWHMLADRQTDNDPRVTALVAAITKELDGKTLQAIAHDTGLRLNGHMAFYGLGLSPVWRAELDDPKAFDAFLGRLETACGKPFDVAKLGEQSYRRYVATASGVEMVIGIVNGQAVIAALPADAPEPMLREALGLAHPAKSLLEDGRLEQLAQAKGYKKQAVGQLDVARMVELAVGGNDPLIKAMVAKDRDVELAVGGNDPLAKPMVAKAGDAATIPDTCKADAKRIASRVPAMSFGYTLLDATHQTVRLDVQLAPDITQAFSGLKLDMPGLGVEGRAPLDVTLGIPMDAVRSFWTAQAQAVAASPFHCETLDKLNNDFAELGEAMSQAAVPPVGDLQGVRFVLDNLDLHADDAPVFAGRFAIGSRNPEGLLAMGSSMNEGLRELGLKPDGKLLTLPAKDVPLPVDGAWAAMSHNAIAVGLGANQDKALTSMLDAKTGDVGQLFRFHMSGAFYSQMMHEYYQKTLSNLEPLQGEDEVQGEAAATKSQGDLLKQLDTLDKQLQNVKSMDASAHMEKDGLVITFGVQMQ